MVTAMFRKLLGFVSGVIALGSAMFVVMAVADLIGGTSATAQGVLMGLFVFFSGLVALTGWSAVQLLRDPAKALVATTTTTTTTAPTAPTGPMNGIDIALEAQILHLAARNDGRITATEIALECGVSLDAASKAIDLLAMRGYADLAVTPDGDTVYVIKGFVSRQEKHLAEALV